VGGGIETMLGGNWSAKAEYLYIDVGSADVFNAGFEETAHFDNHFHIYRYGVNYKFGGPSMGAGLLRAHDWTGFYAGLSVGAGLSQDVFSGPTDPNNGASSDIAYARVTGSLQAGYNWQFDPNWVAGLEGDIGYLGNKRAYIFLNDGAPTASGFRTNWYGTARGRLGYNTGQALLYVTGGAAFVNVKNNFDDTFFQRFASRTETAGGWTVGGGIEAALAQRWTAKAEYLYIDAGSQDVSNPDITRLGAGHFENRFHIFRYGLNYKFGG
jgi:outer membrane immunogenic protein